MIGVFFGMLSAGAASLAVAAANRPPTTPPPPRSQSERDLAQWSRDYVWFNEFVKAARSPTEQLLYDPESVELNGDNLRVLVRLEFYRPQRVAQGAFRSARDRWDLDCKGRRVRKAASEAYPQNNLQGRALSIDVSQQGWTAPYAVDTPVASLIEQACSIGSVLRGGADRAKGMPPSSIDTTEEGTRAWVVKNIGPEKYAMLWSEYGAGVFYDPTAVGKADSGRPLVWLRSEFTAVLSTPHSAWRSTLEQYEIDCPARRYRTLKQQVFPGSNLTGAAYVDPDLYTGWQEAEAGSLDAKWMRPLCAGLKDPAAMAEIDGQPPAPAELTEEGAQAWLETYINTNGYAVVHFLDSEAMLYATGDLERQDDGHILATLRRELFKPYPVGEAAIRSVLERVELDCRGMRSRITAATVHALSNLEGPGFDDKPGNWEKQAAGSNGAILLRQLCSQSSLLADGVDRGKAMPTPLRTMTDAAKQQWIADNLDFGDYTLSGYTDDAVALYSNSELERTRQDFIRIWARLEFFRPDSDEEKVVRSMRVLMEFDCEQQRSRTLAVEAYPGANLTGELQSESFSEAEWSFNAPRTLPSMLGNDLCEMKDRVDAEDSDPAKALPTSTGMKTL